MQPPPDAIGEFKVVTNNMSAEYGRAAGATINVNYRSGTQRVPRQRLGVPPRHGAERDRLLQAADGRSRRSIATSSAASFGGPIVKNRAFFFGDYEGLRQTRKVTGFSTHRDAARSARASWPSTSATRGPASSIRPARRFR